MPWNDDTTPFVVGVTVEQYGARGGDATHDDGPGIQAAINAAAARGVPVVFSRKTYYLNAPQNVIDVPSGARLELNGATLQVAAVAGQMCIGLRLDNVSDAEISGGTIAGVAAGASPPTGMYGLWLHNAVGVRLIDLELSNHWLDGVLISGTSDQVQQHRVYAHDNRRAGCSVIGGSRLSFIDGVYSDSGDDTDPVGAANGINIEVEAGFSVEDVLIDNCELSGNGVAADSTGGGLIVRQGIGGTRPSNIRIARCRVKDNLIVGCSLNNVDGAIIAECYASGHNGAVVGGANQYAFGFGDCTNIEIRGNRGDDNSRFILAAGCDGVSVIGNVATGRADTITGDDYDGINVRNLASPDLTSRSVSIVGNIMIAFGGCGIVAASCGSAVIDGNQCKDNGQHGVLVQASQNALVSANHASGNSRQQNATYSDIRIGAGSDKAAVVSNMCRWHEKYSAGTAQAPFGLDWLTLDSASSSASWDDDWLVGAPIRTTGGTGSGQQRTINIYDAATRRAEVDQLGIAPDATTTYAIRFANLTVSSIGIDAGSTSVRVVGNDVRDASQIADSGTTSVVANNTLGDFGAQPIVTTTTMTAASLTASGFIAVGTSPATTGTIRLGNGFSIWTTSLGGTSRVLMELANLSSSRYTIDIAGTAAGVAGVRVFGNGTPLFETSSNSNAIGFFGTAPAVKPNVTGSRGGNAALASLLTSLAGLGLITDGSSA